MITHSVTQNLSPVRLQPHDSIRHIGDWTVCWIQNNVSGFQDSFLQHATTTDGLIAWCETHRVNCQIISKEGQIYPTNIRTSTPIIHQYKDPHMPTFTAPPVTNQIAEKLAVLQQEIGKKDPGVTVTTVDLQTALDSQAGGIKSDAEKLPVELLDAHALEGLTAVLAFGANKYAPNNWRKGFNYSRLIAALLRHTFALMKGERNDPESGLPHIDHIGCCWMFLSNMMKTRSDLDDLPVPGSSGPYHSSDVSLNP